MNWMDWVIVTFLSLGTLATVSQVGKPRKPLDHSTAVISAVITIALIVGLILTH